MNIINSYTLKTLKKNRMRTLVTIIGIILSAAMLTAVTTFISSLQGFLVETVIESEGEWHGAEIGVDSKGLSYIEKSGEVSSSVYMQSVGYAKIDEIINTYKPYLYIANVSDGFTDKMPVKVIDGRLPQKEGELLLPKHLRTNGGVTYNLGDKLTLDVGSRLSGNEKLTQYSALYTDDNGEVVEKLVPERKAEYTVVGFYERPNFEQSFAPGYTALTVGDSHAADSYDVYFCVNNLRNLTDFMMSFGPDKIINAAENVNVDLLRMYGSSSDSEYNQVLYGLGAVLIIIIMFASVSLIYNAFSISVSERTKQFGIISSVGATKKQLFKSVLFEALVLSAVGIPLGILSGIAGIAVTLKATQELFTTTFSAMSENAVLSVKVTALSVVAAAVVGLITVLISAFIPAKRAVRVSAIDAIRQTADVSVKADKVKTNKLTYKLFGFEGMIASKNFKRNRKKYRTTVLSLFMSVVLFMSASSLVAYLKRSVEEIVEDYDCDIYYQLDEDNTLEENKALYEQLKHGASVTSSSFVNNYEIPCILNKSSVNSKFLDYGKEKDTWMFSTGDDNLINQNVSVVFVDDESYREYLTEKKLDVDKYMNSENPVALATDSVKAYNSEDGRYRTFKVFSDSSPKLELCLPKNIDGYEYTYFEENSAGTLDYIFMPDGVWDEDNAMRLDRDKAFDLKEINIGGITDEAFAMGTGLGIRIMYPQSAMKAVLGRDTYNMDSAMLFNSGDHSKTYDDLYMTLENSGYSTGMLVNLAEQTTVNRAIISIANVFAYGFITLISLIAAANVFNTITTNINLRRREFATLRSVGMTGKGFRKMMDYECLLYGIKSLLYGLPVSLGVTVAIYFIINNGVVSEFFIPWGNVIIAVVSVFAVVFATMLYATGKIKKEDTVEALKNENL